MKKLNEIRVYRTKIDNVTFILTPLGRYRYLWTVCPPEDIINPVCQCFSTDNGF